VAFKVMDDVYAPLVRQGNPLYKMSNVSAEMTKYAANCFLATKISFINEIARLCDRTGADINEVRDGIKSDERIGHHFLYPGPGYGGSCFPKDVKALLHTARTHDSPLELVEAAER
jgi:UDPglucose 6-dehydrogenase